MRRRIVAIAIGACAAYAACGRGDSDTAPASGSASGTAAPGSGSGSAPGALQQLPTGGGTVAPATPTAPQTKLTAKHDGQTIAMTSAAAVRWGDDAVRILVANNPVPCAQAVGGARVGTPRDDVSFYVALTRKHAPDGSTSWELTGYTFDDADEHGDLAAAAVTGDIEVGKTFDATIGYKNVTGTISALVCGDHPPDDATPTDKPAPKGPVSD